MNSQSSGLVACQRKFVSQGCLEALCLLCCIIFICMHMDTHSLFRKDMAFWVSEWKFSSTVWRGALKWSSWVFQDMTLELSLAVWVELAVLWNYYGLVQLLSDEVVTWWTVVTRQWSTWCHACRQKVTPTGLRFWYPLNQNRVFWLLMRAVLDQKNIVSIRALWEREDHTYVNILKENL